jgi:phosphotransferase system, enzyme I, PtsP
MTAGVGNPRLLLRRLRDIMAEPVPAQGRLDRIVTLIAANMVAEVCSIYLQRSSGELELFATEGLNKDAVHKTRLKRGEGLVGDIALNARPLNLPDAQNHPQFSYKPETGEEIYQSLMGVPILRDGRSIGVLVVQNKTRRLYDEEEVEALQTIAMLLAEVAAQGDSGASVELADTGLRRDRPWQARGAVIAEGLAIGRIVFHEPRVRVERLIAEDPGAEAARLHGAVADLRQSVDQMLDLGGPALSGDSRDVLETYRMFAHDKGWFARLDEAVQTGLTAEAAVERVQSEMRARLSRLSDPYIRERLHDFDDLANRLMRHLAGQAGTAADPNLPDDAILVARSMGPAELLDYDRAKLQAVVLEEGSPTSHVAIIARALGIPLVGRVEGLVEACEAGHTMIADGDTGDVHVRPAPDLLNAYRARISLRMERQKAYAALRDAPCVTRDGAAITLLMNAGLAADLPQLASAGAAGIGLFRTELPFMVTTRMPSLADQTALYAKVLEEAGERPVTFRTLDLGGDKALPYMELEREENPAMGWRAIRIGLDRPALLRFQLRAMIRAASGRALRVMFPMIADTHEFLAARAHLDRELARARTLGQTLPRTVEAGTMLEVPSLAFGLGALLDQADFVSVGTNDLMQFFFAADRGHPRIGTRYDTLAPSFLRMLAAMAETCAGSGKPLTVCGEMAGRPLEALALAAIGITRLSMQPHAIGPVKAMLLSLDRAQAARFIRPLLASPARTLRPALEAYASDNAVALG